MLLGGRLNSRHGRETHGITVGTQENRISRHRQISQHKKQITMGTAHSSHPITSPNLNKTMRALWKTSIKSIRKEHTENQITMGTAHSSHPMTSPNLNKTMRALCKTTRKSIRKEHRENQITMGTAHSSDPMTSPNLNKTMRALWKTSRKSIRKEHSEHQITMGTAHSSHPMTSPNLHKKCAHCGKQPENQSERNIVNTKSPWARLIYHIH